MDDTPQGVTPEEVPQYVRLVALQRCFTSQPHPSELAKLWFLHLQTIIRIQSFRGHTDELGDAWKGGGCTDL